MTLSEVCIKRPVLAWVLTFVIVLLGLVSWDRLPLQQYPTIARSFVTVETSLPGAGPEIVENQVTQVIEEAMSGIEGVEEITSVSSTEDSKVTVEFRPERKMEDALNDIRDRLLKFKDRLPDDVSDPVLTKSRSEDKPIITLALTSDEKETSELADFAIREIQKDLESITGVARVDVLGAGQYVMRIQLDPIKLAAYNITVNEVLTALKRQSLEKPAGKIISAKREFLVTTVANLEKPEEFEELIIAEKQGYLVRVKDIGRAQVDADDRRTKTRYNGKPGVSIGIVKQSVANPIAVARQVRAQVEEIRPTLPDGVFIHIGTDKTTYVERSIKEVYSTIIEAIILVVLVVFLFLRSFRASLIPLVTIPISLIGALFLMYILNFSLNTLTLMAMVLAVGLVVDDAIVVMENIYVYLERGMKPMQAAIEGIKEIRFAVIAITLTLVAVYTPVSLAQGLTGKLLTEFSITLAGAVLISGFAALTLSPMMCSRMLSADSLHIKNDGTLLNRLKSSIPTEAWLEKLEIFYDSFLRICLNKKLLVTIIAVGISLFGFVIYKYLPSELTPKEDKGSIFLEGQAPQTATLGYTDESVKKLEKHLEKIPEIERMVVQINNPTFDISIQLKEERKRSTEEIEDEIRDILRQVVGVDASITGSGGGVSGDDNRAAQFVIRGNKTHKELAELARSMTSALYSTGMAMGIRSEVRQDTEDFVVNVLRDKASSLSIEPASIAEAIDALIRGRKANTFKRNNKLYDVKVEVLTDRAMSPDDITNIFVRSKEDKKGTLVPLSEVVKVSSRSGPVEIRRQNRQRSFTISMVLQPSYSLAEGINKISEIAKETMPNDVRVSFVGETKRYLKESKTIAFIFALALAFIYFVMAAQFESWRDPFIILLSVPLALTGAVLTLGLIKNGSLNIYSNIGLVTLVGLITKHGILMVEFANQLKQSMTVDNAIVEACKKRLRPILMTTFAMVLGAIPLAFSTGAGAETRRQLGWTIVGGMSIGTIFTLFVVPVFYALLTKKIIKNDAN